MSDQNCPECDSKMSEFNGSLYCELCSSEYSEDYQDEDSEYQDNLDGEEYVDNYWEDYNSNA